MNEMAAQNRQRPEISYEQRKNQPKPSKKGPKNGPKKKTASVSGWDDEIDDEPFETVTYGDRMKFAVPFEQKKRKRMKLAKGMKIVVDDSYEKFNEEEFKQRLASDLANSLNSEDPMVPTPSNHADTGNPIADSAGTGSTGGGTAMSDPAITQIDPQKEDL
jgi:hypothetical protein